MVSNIPAGARSNEIRLFFGLRPVDRAIFYTFPKHQPVEVQVTSVNSLEGTIIH